MVETKIDLKRFTIAELKGWFVAEGEDPLMNDVHVKTPCQDTLADNEELTISDHFTMTAYKGSENFYLDLLVWRGDCVEIELNIWTKEAHHKLEEFINEIIKQS